MTAIAKVLSHQSPATTSRQPNMDKGVILSIDKTDGPSDFVKEHLILGTDERDALHTATFEHQISIHSARSSRGRLTIASIPGRRRNGRPPIGRVQSVIIVIPVSPNGRMARGPWSFRVSARAGV